MNGQKKGYSHHKSKKKEILLSLLLTIVMLIGTNLPIVSAVSSDTYAIYDSTTQTLTFAVGTETGSGVLRANGETVSGDVYYSDFIDKYYGFVSAGNIHYDPWNAEYAPWHEQAETISTIVFLDPVVPSHARFWFYELQNLENIQNIELFDVSSVTDFCFVFGECTSLTSLDLSSWDTSCATSMREMFSGCSGLTSLNLSGFDTSHVWDTFAMFENCSSLTSLDLASFDTSNLSFMMDMFRNCSELSSLDLSSFNTSNVTDMWGVFEGCSSLTSLDVTGFDTSNVTTMTYMFAGCSSLTTLDLTGFNTSNVTHMFGVFEGCSGLTSLDVTSFNTTNVIDMGDMFLECSGLTSLDITGFDTSNVRFMSSMFEDCSGLTSLDVTSFNTASVTDMREMFRNCSSLTSLNVTGFDTSKVTDMNCMFTDCSGLTSLDVTSFNTANVTDMTGMFDFCTGLTELDVSNFDTSKVTRFFATFRYLTGLTELDVSHLNTSSATDMWDMFRNCSNVTALDVSNFDTSNVTSFEGMFMDCYKLTQLDVSGFDTSSATNMADMFSWCYKLPSIDVTGFETSNVETFSRMFYDCRFSELDLSSFDMTNASEVNGIISDIPLRILTLGEKNTFSPSERLQIPSTTFPYTGKWIRVNGDSTTYTSEELMNTYDGATMAGTYVWETLDDDLDAAIIDPIPDQIYTGSEITPPLTVRLNGDLLTENVDYTVDYNDNIEIGEATATVTGIAPYAGNQTVPFTIYCAHGRTAERRENVVGASCLSDGSYTLVTYCTLCNEVLSRETVPVGSIGHAYELSDWTWTKTADGYTAVAHFVCANDPAHTQDVTAVVALESDAPECEVPGQIVYTASLTFEGNPYSDTKTVTLDPTGHAYSLSGWTWTETATGYTATAHFVCGNDPEHTKDIAATVTPATTAPDCEHGGQTVYTASVTFEGTTYSDTKTVTLDPIGHAYAFSGWTWTETTGGYKAVAHFFCTNDPAHKADFEATVTSVTDDPDCVNGGQTVYTAKVTFEGENYADTKTVILDPLGHDLISHAGKAATCAEKGWEPYETCSRCDYTTYREIPARGHDYQIIATIAATCTENGTRTYVCKNDAAHTYTDEIDALGHNFGKWFTVKEASTEETGLERRECSRCDAFEERIIPKIKEGDSGKTCKCLEKLMEFFKKIIAMLTSMFHVSNSVC